MPLPRSRPYGRGLDPPCGLFHSSSRRGSATGRRAASMLCAERLHAAQRPAFLAERMKYIAHRIPTAEPTAALGATPPGTDK